MAKHEEINLNPEGFTPIRNGLREHIKQGKLHPTDLGIYLYLHLECSWSTGIYHGTAAGIAFGFDDESLKNMVQKSLSRLRKAGYINYRDGDGRRKGYPILIHKFRPRVGRLLGTELDAWKHGDKCVPEYVSSAVEPLSGGGGAAEERWLSGREAVVERPIQEGKEGTTGLQDFQEGQEYQTRGDSPSASSTQEDQNQPTRSLAEYIDELENEESQQPSIPKPTPPVREMVRPAPYQVTSRKCGHVFGRQLGDNGSRCLRCRMHYQLWESRGKPSCEKEETDVEALVAHV